MRGVAVELFGDATHVDTGATQACTGQTAIVAVATMHTAGLGQRHFGTALRRHARRPHAATAAADDEKVKFIGLHI